MQPPDTRRPKELTPGNEIGSYKIQRSIGAGGEAILYAAYDRRDLKQVALKFPHVATVESIQRLRHEVAMGHEVHHPHVCKSDRVAVEGEFTFGVMEYVEGENLKEILRRRGRLPRNVAERVAAELCAGVSGIHTPELVHRDLKPANIMLDADGHVKIVDLSLATFEGRGRGEIFGTPEYMAPEQIEGRVPNRALDIFALGVLLYEVFTGKQWLTLDPNIAADRNLSPRERDLAQLKAIRQQQTVLPAPPSHVNRELDFNVDDLILGCLVINPEARPKIRDLREKWAALAEA